jgi:hypothetical protein
MGARLRSLLKSSLEFIESRSSAPDVNRIGKLVEQSGPRRSLLGWSSQTAEREGAPQKGLLQQGPAHSDISVELHKCIRRPAQLVEHQAPQTDVRLLRLRRLREQSL